MNNVYHLPGLLPPSLPRILVPVPSADHIPLLLLIGCLSKVCVSQLNKATYRPLISLRRKSTAAVTQYRLTSRASKTSFPISTPAMRLTWGWIWTWGAFQKARIDVYHLSSQLFQPSSPRVILIVTLLTRVSILILVSPPTVVVANIPVATDSWRRRGCEAESDSLRWTMSTIVTNPPHAGKRWINLGTSLFLACCNGPHCGS